MAVSTNEVWGEFSESLERFIVTRVQDGRDAEDILQDVFLKIHSNIGNLEDESKLRAWLYQITRNAIIDYYRSRKVTVELPAMLEGTTGSPGAGEGVAGELASCLKPMIDRLPEKYRQAIVLTELEGLTQKRMAEELGLSLSGAKSRVQRARRALKDMLLQCCHLEVGRLGGILDYQPKEKTCQFCAGNPTGE